MWDGFIKNLEKTTGKKVAFFPVQSNAAQYEAMRSGRLHVAGVNAGGNALAVNCAGFVPFAMMAAPDNSFGYEMEIIVPADSPIKAPTDLKGHKIAFTDATSNSGFKAPSAILKADFSLEAKRDFEPVFSGKHDNSILGVVNKDYEAAAVANSVLNRMIDRKVFDKAKIRSIYKSADLPDHRLRLRPQPRSEAGREDQGGLLQLPLGGLGAARPSSRRKASSSRSTTRRTGRCCARSTTRPASNTLANRLTSAGARRMLRIKGLAKRYRTGDLALKGIDLDVPDGQVMALIGPSGAGKSTVIRCINRLVEPTAGTVTLNDIEITTLGRGELRRARRRMGMIFQEYALVERLSVMENVLSGRLGYVGFWQSFFRKFPQSDIDEAFRLLARVGLDHMADKRADELSGGQRQRVGICRALIQNPELLLVDEPTASLDPKTSRQIMRLIKELCAERKLSAIINIHDVMLAQMFAERIVGLQLGEIVYDGPPDNLTAEVLTKIYGEEDWSATIRKVDDEAAEAEATKSFRRNCRCPAATAWRG